MKKIFLLLLGVLMLMGAGCSTVNTPVQKNFPVTKSTSLNTSPSETVKASAWRIIHVDNGLTTIQLTLAKKQGIKFSFPEKYAFASSTFDTSYFFSITLPVLITTDSLNSENFAVEAYADDAGKTKCTAPHADIFNHSGLTGNLLIDGKKFEGISSVGDMTGGSNNWVRAYRGMVNNVCYVITNSENRNRSQADLRAIEEKADAIIKTIRF